MAPRACTRASVAGCSAAGCCPTSARRRPGCSTRRNGAWTTCRRPTAGHVAFVVLTFDGMHRLEVPERDAMTVAGAAHDLYVAAQGVVAELRKADANRPTSRT